FVGCSGTLSDPNFSALINWMTTTAKGIANRHYLLMNENDKLAVDRQSLRSASVISVTYGRAHSDLPKFLYEISVPKKNPIQPNWPDITAIKNVYLVERKLISGDFIRVVSNVFLQYGEWMRILDAVEDEVTKGEPGSIQIDRAKLVLNSTSREFWDSVFHEAC